MSGRGDGDTVNGITLQMMMMVQVVQAVTAAMAMMVVVMSIIIDCYSAIVGLNAIYVISNVIGGCGCQ